MQDNQAVTLHLPRTLRIGRLVAFFLRGCEWIGIRLFASPAVHR